jgi:hypothetical protein
MPSVVSLAESLKSKKKYRMVGLIPVAILVRERCSIDLAHSTVFPLPAVGRQPHRRESRELDCMTYRCR